MKRSFIIYILSAIILAGTWSCKKEENKVIFEGGTAPVVTSSISSGGDIPLSFATQGDEALKLSWTNPQYQFNTGISSLDVNYDLEIDTTGSNFTNPKRAQISLGTNLDYTLTQGDLNSTLNVMKLQDSVSHNLEMRISAFLVSQVGQPGLLYSDVLKFTATPYAVPPKVNPPASGTLYLTGSATPDGWMVGGDPSSIANPVDQQFTKISNTFYTITISLIGGQEYLFVPVAGDWTHKYAVKDKTLSGLSSGGDFGADLNDNFPGPAASGKYKIDVDFQIGQFTVTPQ